MTTMLDTTLRMPTAPQRPSSGGLSARSSSRRYSNPNLVPIIAASVDEGLPFDTGPFADGEGVRAWLARGGLGG